MRRYLQYLLYLLVHKRHVAVGIRRVSLGWIRAIIHDYDKFHPGMFIAYARFFYYPDGSRIKYGDQSDIVRTNMTKWWHWHNSRNAHHWEYHVENISDRSSESMLLGDASEMPKIDILEMIADWYGAGIAIHGKEDVAGWFEDQIETNRMNLHPSTLIKVRIAILAYFPNTGQEQKYESNI